MNSVFAPRSTCREASGGVIHFRNHRCSCLPTGSSPKPASHPGGMRVALMKRLKRTPHVSEARRSYDFSRGVRGKYARRFAGGAMIPGVQFVVDEDGEKT